MPKKNKSKQIEDDYLDLTKNLDKPQEKITIVIVPMIVERIPIRKMWIRF